MKTPEEIKKGLEHCRHCGEYKDCAYYPVEGMCISELAADALAYIQQLEAAAEAIANAPAVDAVEMIRCKDCVCMGKRPPLPDVTETIAAGVCYMVMPFC